MLIDSDFGLFLLNQPAFKQIGIKRKKKFRYSMAHLIDLLKGNDGEYKKQNFFLKKPNKYTYSHGVSMA